MVSMQITNLGDERPIIGQLRRIELERACDHFGIEYNNTSDGAYVLMRRLQHIDESELLKAIGRIDLLPDQDADQDLRDQLAQTQAQVQQLMNVIAQGGLKMPGQESQQGEFPEGWQAKAYGEMSIQELRKLAHERGLEQSPRDTMAVLREKLMAQDEAQEEG